MYRIEFARKAAKFYKRVDAVTARRINKVLKKLSTPNLQSQVSVKTNNLTHPNDPSQHKVCSHKLKFQSLQKLLQNSSNHKRWFLRNFETSLFNFLLSFHIIFLIVFCQWEETYDEIRWKSHFIVIEKSSLWKSRMSWLCCGNFCGKLEGRIRTFDSKLWQIPANNTVASVWYY